VRYQADPLDLVAPIPDLKSELPPLKAHHHPPELLSGNLLSIDHEHGEQAILACIPGDAPTHQ
jgi:hypothetical protein